MVLLIISALVVVVGGAPIADEVTSLPGWELPLPSRMYSGFVDVGPAKVHYWYIESESEPSIDPTLVWTNGGPMASSMFGIMVELGPLRVDETSLLTPAFEKTGVPSLFRNDYAWTKLGSVLMFDWPPPVGFSYCAGEPSNTSACGTWNDDSMAVLAHAALRGFYALFPERRSNELYLVGESYAGVYVPRLVEQILDDDDDDLQLKGFAVGDACAGTDVLCGNLNSPRWWDVIFFFGHGQVSNLLFDAIVDTCGLSYLKHGGVPPDGCDDILDDMDRAIGGYYEYSLYDACIYEDGLRRRRLHSRAASVNMRGALNDYPCGGGPALDVWVNQSAVRRALHVPVDSVFFEEDGDDSVYTLTETNVMPIYRRASAEGLRILVYNGDADPSINSFAAQNWTASIGFNVTQPWRPWTLDSCKLMGGYVTRYEGNFDFLTIRGSGHMVPEYKPQASFQFLAAWLANTDYLPYEPDCQTPTSLKNAQYPLQST
ncbi:hypothetical protein CTAYLR_002890 [Chrysophaeum taylorii]|uniref:Carboxypeptidase n=1 Tax=Chrysophaeum taylorii TaxID=2483200 RepID=A0AAD7UMU1_9STRA|nr:hypothetical protein CTAYLR_002890 [Chrysophaeum taylorii]